MYSVSKAVTYNLYDLFVNGIHVLRDSKLNIDEFIRTRVKPLGLVSGD